jgi:uncharacterized protein (DUF1800 family)
VAADRPTIAHLLRRAGFGPTPAEVDAAVAAGYDATVEQLLDFTSPDPADRLPAPAFASAPAVAGALSTVQRQAAQQQRAADFTALVTWWLTRMGTTAHPLREKLTLFWHGHFATSFDKVQRADLMYKQNQLLRTMGAGDFEALAQAVAKDPAMMIWLDTRLDKASHPNENFARELMELFTLGIGNYSENDVREAARAFTGWAINPATASWVLQVRQHDAGQKTILGQTGNLGGEDVVHIVANHPAGEAFIVSGVWSHFAYPVAPTDQVVSDLLPVYRAGHDIRSLMRSVFMHPQFVSAQARTGLVKQPVEWMIGMLRALGLPAGARTVIGALNQLGQVPLRPPNVGGWPQNTYWLTTASSLARLRIASAAVKLAHSSAASPDAAARLLSTDWSDQTAQVLGQSAGNPQQLVTLALVAPEYVLA